MDEEVKAYRVSEFCRSYKISRTSFYKEVNEHRLHMVKRGRRTLIAKDEAERWFASLFLQSRSHQSA